MIRLRWYIIDFPGATVCGEKLVVHLRIRIRITKTAPFRGGLLARHYLSVNSSEREENICLHFEGNRRDSFDEFVDGFIDDGAEREKR